jgi:hypothetical protein
VNFINTPVGVHDVDLTWYILDERLILFIEFLEVFEGHTVVACLTPLLNVLPGCVDIFGQKYVNIRIPGIMIIELVIRGVFPPGHCSLLQ